MPCLVTGHLQTLGASFSQGFVVFQLYNIGQGSMPQVLGVSEFNSLKYVVVSDPTGFFTTSLWGNDVINPQNTVYLVTLRDFYGNEVGPIMFSIIGPSFNLDTASPITTTIPPVYVPPSGYAAGATVTAANFAISGWGVGASITQVLGVQQRCSILITAGIAPIVSPTITYTYPGSYPAASYVIAQMSFGTGSVSDLNIQSTASGSIFIYQGLPVQTRTYGFVIDVVGN